MINNYKSAYQIDLATRFITLKRMSFSKRIILSLTLALMVSVAGKAQVVWQWSVPVNNTTGAKAGSKAYLWIPEKCKRIRAFIFAQNNMEEQSILENANFR